MSGKWKADFFGAPPLMAKTYPHVWERSQWMENKMFDFFLPTGKGSLFEILSGSSVKTIMGLTTESPRHWLGLTPGQVDSLGRQVRLPFLVEPGPYPQADPIWR